MTRAGTLLSLRAIGRGRRKQQVAARNSSSNCFVVILFAAVLPLLLGQQLQTASTLTHGFRHDIDRGSSGEVVSHAGVESNHHSNQLRRRMTSVGAADNNNKALSGKRRAYVTLLYSDFIHGTRALGQSLRDSRTSADIVVLVTPDVTPEARNTLSRDGWIIRPVDVEGNPNANFQSRLIYVYTKLLVVDMEDEYDSVVFLDADTLVLSNVDELFFCGPFCAVMRHSELLNSGVAVITPSRKLYDEMKNVIADLDSYTGGDQGFLNSFYPYFAACPAFEPYPTHGSALAGPGMGPDTVNLALDGGLQLTGYEGWGKKGRVPKGRVPRGGRGEGQEGIRVRGCKRLPTRYNGDWPLLFVDGDLQVVQGQVADPHAPLDWTRRKAVKIIHFTFGTAKPWHWWTYPFLPFVDLWLEAFFRADRSGDRRPLPNQRVGPLDMAKRPRWAGVWGQLAWGLAPLAIVALLWRLCMARTLKRWVLSRLALCKACSILTTCTIPSKALNARSLSGSLFNLGVGLALALSAVVVAFRAVPAAQLGPARPEAAWAFFWARSTSLVVLFYGFYLFLVVKKAERVLSLASSTEMGSGSTRDHANAGGGVGDNGNTREASKLMSNVNTNDSLHDHRRSAPWAGSHSGTRGSRNGIRTPVGAGKKTREGSSGEWGATAKSTVRGGVGGRGEWRGWRGGGGGGRHRRGRAPESKAWIETVSHLVCLSAMTVSLVTAPLWQGLNGSPASQEVLPGLARLVSLFIVFTFSAIRLPTLWATHAIVVEGRRRSNLSHRVRGGSFGGGVGSNVGGAGPVRRDGSDGSGHSDGLSFHASKMRGSVHVVPEAEELVNVRVDISDPLLAFP